MTFTIRESTTGDLSQILALQHQAFGDAEGSEIAKLITDLLVDETAMPFLSLVAETDNKIVGYVLFTHARVITKHILPKAVILAPLAVSPNYQNQGIGVKLIKHGCELLVEQNIEIVLVLGYPAYYSKFGFVPTQLIAPYPIADKNKDAWMIKTLSANISGDIKGKVICAKELDKPQYWQE
jgi:predicted N-acetyltransferase YhbS